MTDGEPTMGWSNYTFSSSPSNPVPEGSAGSTILSPIPPNTEPGTFYGDGSWGEMGVSLLTVLTAAHRKRLVLNSYFGSANAVTPGEPGQPPPAVGFFSIAFGTQPAGTATELIKATMSPGNPGFVPNVDNASGISYDIRRGMTDLISSPYGPPAPVGNPGGTNVFRMNPNPPPATNGYGGDMGNLLRAFAAPTPLPIEFHVSRRQAFSSYLWDSTPLRITNTENLTLAEINFADLFATPTNLDELKEVFEQITINITNQGFQDNITATDPDSERSFDGYLTFTDVLGEYMQVRNVSGLTYQGASFSRAAFASTIAGNSTQRNEYINILYHHMNYGTDPGSPIYLSETAVAALVASNIASPTFQDDNSIKYYANTNRDWVGNYYLSNGTPAPIPADAAALVEVFPMWGTLNTAQAPLSGDTNLRTITFHVITALRTAGFAELYAESNPGNPLMRMLNAGDQMIRWYIPSSLIPVRTPEFDTAGNFTGTVSGNTLPIRVNFTVGLDRTRVEAGIPPEVFAQYQVGDTNQMYFYSNRNNPNLTNVTLAFFRPHEANPYYRGIGDDERSVVKTQNPTNTAPHVNRNRLVGYSGSATGYDMHWLGNNGRLTFDTSPPPTPPPSLGDLTISKTFEGLPSELDVFNTDIISQISFLVIGTNAAGTEIYRETVIFNSTDFRWNDTLSRFEYTLKNLPFGNYRIYERGGNVLVGGYTVTRPNPPQTVSITSTGQQVSVSFENSYTPDPVPPEQRPALTIWKTFHGLANDEIPTSFRIRITGPGDFSETIDYLDAIQGVTFTNLTLGNYTISEMNANVPGFDLSVTIDNQPRTLPYTFAIEDANAHIVMTMDNEYEQTPPPPPSALGDLTILKTFEGVPSEIDVFNTDIISQISFLVIGTNAAGTEIFRETVLFNSTNFRWNNTLNGYEFTLRNLPFGSYRVYERGGNMIGHTVNRPALPQTVSITSTGQQVRVSFNNNYTPTTPVPPGDLPALTIWKVFHGLANAEIPTGFQIRITGPGAFSETISYSQAIAGRTFTNLEQGAYTITELGNNVPGFNMSVTINNQLRTLPFTFTIDSVAHIAMTIDNDYERVPPPPTTPTPPPETPPSPQTGLRSFVLPMAILLSGVAIVGAAEIYRRRNNKNATKEQDK
jgi:hypothetical protein